ncbi:MAG TPA: hypothetical protein VG815_04250, partial [Chloroflexota bacterium]|nr:hypothetical protein [Chloroflexota bacterium]
MIRAADRAEKEWGLHGARSLRGIAILMVIVNCPLVTSSERARAALSTSDRVSGLLVSGNRLYLNGHLFTPKGFNLVAALYSKQCYYDYLRNAARHFTAREMKAMKAWDINTIRLQVSQTAL